MTLRKHENLFRFSVTQEQQIVNLYINNISISKIAKLYKADRDTITRIIKKNNINVRKYNYLRKHPLNEHYFDNIDSQDKAYFLGLLYADGCNHFDDKRKKVSISLQEEDADILRKFSNYLYNIEFLQFLKGRDSNKNQIRLTIHSRKISQVLNNLGCTSQKSLKLKAPIWLTNPDLQRHFIRGYFDGDGCLSKYQHRKSYAYKWTLISTQEFCELVTNILKTNLSIHVSQKLTCPKTDNKITHTISVSGNQQIIKLLDWLYKNSFLHLNRKFQKFQQLKSLYYI